MSVELVGTRAERQRLIQYKTFFESVREDLFTPENRRGGIQVAYMELLRLYEDALELANRPFTQALRDEFEFLRENVERSQRFFASRFIPNSWELDF
uniref:V-type ATP synthase subunit A n=1 Tax=Caenorhabditis tropicalis TaxID=1561998 RepID=A0A1I7T204_9PELO